MEAAVRAGLDDAQLSRLLSVLVGVEIGGFHSLTEAASSCRSSGDLSGDSLAVAATEGSTGRAGGLGSFVQLLEGAGLTPLQALSILHDASQVCEPFVLSRCRASGIAAVHAC
jgi:hypothetical protein